MLGMAGVTNYQGDASGVCRSMFSLLAGFESPSPGEALHINLENTAIIVSSDMADLTGQPAFLSPDKSILVGINGEISNGEELLGCGKGEGLSPGEIIHSLYSKHGIGFIEDLIGAFSIVIEDRSCGKVFLISDRYGLRPLYYSIIRDSMYYASKVKAIEKVLPAAPSIDDHGLADFLFFGMPTGSRTLRRNISLLPPATVLTFRNGKANARLYWELAFNPSRGLSSSINKMSLDFATRFEKSVERTFRNDISYDLPLSGGMDSRCILAAAPDDALIRSYTIGSSDSYDLELGKRTAELSGIANETSIITAEDFINWIPESIYITDGMYNPVHAPILHIARALPEDARVVIDGISSFDGYYMFPELFFPLNKVDRKTVRKLFLKACPEPIVDENLEVSTELIQSDFSMECSSLLRDSLSERCDLGLKKAGNTFDGIDYIEQSNRIQRYNIMGSELLRSRCEVRHPMFDQSFIDLVTGFPLMGRSKEKLVMGRYLQRKDKDLGNLVYDRTGLPARAGKMRHIANYSQLVLNRVLSRVTGRRRKPKVAIDYYDFFTRDKALQELYMDTLLAPGFLDNSMIRTDMLESYLNGLFKGQMANLGLASRLLTIELWYRMLSK